MKPSWIKGILSAFLNLLVCLIGVVIILYRKDWFGSSDVYSFMFWTIPLVIGIAASGKIILNSIRLRNIFFKILCILLLAIVISFAWVYIIFLILGPWINAFSFPVFFLWSAGNVFQLLFLEYSFKLSSTKYELLSGILILVLASTGTSGLMHSFSYLVSYLKRPQSETYLIPEKFNGPFRVSYGENCGLDPKIENGRRILEIPDNGILIIQSPFEEGVIDHEYYIIDSLKNRIGISCVEIFPNQEMERQLPCILLDGSGGILGSMEDGSFSTDSPLAIRYTDFVILKDTSMVNSRNKFNFRKGIDSLTIVIVESCRINKVI